MPRHRKPVAQHKLEGTYEPGRHAHRREVAAQGELAAGSAPLHLSDAERRIWIEVCNVAPARLLKNADRFMLEALVTAIAAHREARAERAATGLLMEPTRGDRIPQINPLAGEIRRQARLIAELGSKLGLTPDARVRLLDSIRPGPNEIPLSPEFLARFGPLRLIPGGGQVDD
jgi:P27 family predicted phage terminase small subunit